MGGKGRTAGGTNDLLLILPVFALAMAGPVVAQVPVATPDTAAQHIGQRVTVEGRVTQVRRPPSGHLMLNFGPAFPNHVFTVFIHQSDAARFTLPDDLEGRMVRVSGTVSAYEGKPQIQLRDPAGLVVAGPPPPTAPPRTDAPPRADPPARAPTPAPSGEKPPGGDTLGRLRRGGLAKYQLALTPEQQRLLEKAANEKNVTHATVGVYLPPDFDPARRPKLFLPFATFDGGFSHISRAQAFSPAAGKSGWVMVAADGPRKPQQFSVDWVDTLLEAALSDLAASELPGLRQWPVACGGNSGGAKLSGWMAGRLAARGYRLTGLFLAGCNNDTVSAGARESKVPSEYKKIAIYVSHGRSDTVATPAMVSKVVQSIKSGGFKNVEVEQFNGGHELNEESLALGMRWLADAIDTPAKPGGPR
jgi:hypothetical protein